jgi:tryptophan synthase alpha chain
MNKPLFENGSHPLIAYLMGGDPDPLKSYEAASVVLEAGADALELGVPFSDPIADGPTIQAASLRSLNAGVTPRKVFELVKELHQSYDKPIYLMTYLNPVFRMGYQRFCESAHDSGLSGVIIPDLPVEAASDWVGIASQLGLQTVFLVSPATVGKRIRKIAALCSGFVYLISVYGVTGARDSLPSYTARFIKNVKSLTSRPTALGFGISSPKLVGEALAAGADGVIVGSALVSKLNASSWGETLTGLKEFVTQLKKATFQVVDR